MLHGSFELLRETAGKVITAIIAPEQNRVLIATEQGMIFECRKKDDGTLDVHQLLDQPIESADRDRPGPLPFTSLDIVDGKVLAGSLSRGLFTIENGMARESPLRPPAFFVRALETDADGKLWLGAQTRKEESGLYQGTAPHNLSGWTLRPEHQYYPRRKWRGLVGTEGLEYFDFRAGRLSVSLSMAPPGACVLITSIQSSSIAKRGLVWYR